MVGRRGSSGGLRAGCPKCEGRRSRGGRRSVGEGIGRTEGGPEVGFVGRSRNGHILTQGLGALEDGADTSVPLAELRLTLDQLRNLVLHELLVEQLTAGDPIDLGA